MVNFFYYMIGWVTRIHNSILSWNDTRAVPFNDKELHFIIIGIVGMLLLFIIYPLFKLLARKDHILTIAWIYVFTLIVVITFAIEIGQGYTGTGSMEFADIMFGVVGFIVMFAIFALVRAIVKTFINFVKRSGSKHDKA